MSSEENKYSITFSTWNKIADLYSEKFMDLKIYDESYDAFCSLLKNNSPGILEIGCGPGNITKYLKNKIPASRILATDVSPNMIALAGKNVPEAEFQILDARNINEIDEKFEGIVCGFCIPYLDEFYLSKLVRDCSALLDPNGIFYVSCIEGNYTDSKFEEGSSGDKAFVHYYSETDLASLFSQNGFKQVASFRIGFTRSSGQKETHLVFLLQKFS
jgi:ubiquinone/menaquinone biosynthesis C-methylase UbiE